MHGAGMTRYAYIAVAILLALLLSGTHWKAYKHGQIVIQARWDTEKSEMAEAAAKAQEKAQATADKVAEKVSRALTKDRIVYREILKEAANVPNYCDLPADVRVLHDAAATAAMPDRSAADADGATVTAQTFTQTVVENYESCQDSARRLQALQEVIRAYNQ